jgi:hypothetical protein
VDQGVALIRQWISEHRPGVTAYHSRDLWAEVTAALGALKPWHWVATLDGTCNPDGRFPAVVQILGAAAVGLDVDLSIVWDDQWHPTPPNLPGSSLFHLRQLAAAILADGQQLQRLAAGL